MQKTNKIEGQDVMVDLKSVMVTERDMAVSTARLDLTADKIAAFVSRGQGKFEIIYANGFTVDAKANMRRVDNAASALISAIMVKGYIFFETTETKDPDRFVRILRQLTKLNDRNGNPIDDLYLVGFGQKRYTQYVLTPDNQVIALTQGQTGLMSVRFDKTNQQLVAIQRDQQGSESLMTLDLGVFLRNPQAVTQIENWQTVARFDRRNVAIALSRPKNKGADVMFVVNFNRTARLLTITGRDQAIWGDIYQTSEIQIGYLSGSSDLMVGYHMTETETLISVTRALPDHPAATYLS